MGNCFTLPKNITNHKSRKFYEEWNAKKFHYRNDPEIEDRINQYKDIISSYDDFVIDKSQKEIMDLFTEKMPQIPTKLISSTTRLPTASIHMHTFVKRPKMESVYLASMSRVWYFIICTDQNFYLFQ